MASTLEDSTTAVAVPQAPKALMVMSSLMETGTSKGMRMTWLSEGA